MAALPQKDAVRHSGGRRQLQPSARGPTWGLRLGGGATLGRVTLSCWTAGSAPGPGPSLGVSLGPRKDSTWFLFVLLWFWLQEARRAELFGANVLVFVFVDVHHLQELLWRPDCVPETSDRRWTESLNSDDVCLHL